jgi:hypothetical protein
VIDNLVIGAGNSYKDRICNMPSTVVKNGTTQGSLLFMEKAFENLM